MVSGSGNSSRKKSGKKEKFVIAKDAKQLRLAIIVVCIFLINTVVAVVRYNQQNSPPTISQNTATTVEDARPTGSTSPSSPDANSMTGSPQNNPNTLIASTPSGASSQTGTPTPPGASTPPGVPTPPGEQTPAGNNSLVNSPTPPPPSVTPGQTMPPQGLNSTTVAPSSQGNNPILPVLFILLLVIGGFYATRKHLPKSIAKSSLNFNLGKTNGKGFAIAKDQKQMVLAVIVMLLFIGVTINSISNYLKAQNPQIISNNQPVSDSLNALPSSENPANTTTAQNPIPAGEPSTLTQQQEAGNIYSQTLNLQANNPANDLNKQPVNPGEEIEIIPRKMTPIRSEKLVSIAVDDSNRPNPFLPVGENVLTPISHSKKYLPPPLPYLTSPPETLPSNSPASRIMNTTISGILYDKYSPSAIINIEGADYLVKKGDVINHYKVLSIAKNQVLVQLGENVYKAGVGELLSQTNLNYNTIANLNKKFGGNDVSINVRKNH